MEFPQSYDAQEAETRIRARWEETRIFSFDPKGQKPIFSIDTPPPTVSGKMHIGHAFSYSQMDFIARYKRMRGFNLFYPFGTDDNGLATDRMVEKLKSVRGRDLGRKNYIKLCLETLNEIRPDFIADWKRIGISADWDLFYTTINLHSQKVSQKSFIELYKAGREYRKEAPTIWCPQCQTAIAQVELEDKELPSFFNDINFTLENGEKITIATTRPELLPSCISIFVHPDDTRYSNIVGKRATVPVFGQIVEILADSRVDKEKGTGIVMCCTFGDLADIDWWQAFNLPLKVSISADGKMNSLAGKYAGLPLKEARKQIIEELKKEGILSSQKQIIHNVNTHERCGTEIEFLVTKQWFIKYLDRKEQFLADGERLKWHPEHMKNRYDNWLKGIQWDWCISRQRFFGVPFPVWYCKKCGQTMLPEEGDLPVDPMEDQPKSRCKCGSSEFEGEKDVLDTWATSSLTPQIAIGLLHDESLKKRVFPMSLRPQAHDIISFWLVHTLVKSQLHNGKNPWDNVMISGWVLDPRGNKMSKSKGNVIGPQEVIQKYSADCLRFWAAGSKLGEDLAYQEKDLVTARKFVTKLWNASKFVSMNLEGFSGNTVTLEIEDKWILGKLNKTIKESTEYFENYEYSKARAVADIFFWQDFCDNYLEMIKSRIYGNNNKAGAQYALNMCLNAVLKLFAPITPFITDEIFSVMYPKEAQSVHVSNWPITSKISGEDEAISEGEKAKAIISTIRKEKSTRGLSLNTEVKKLEIFGKQNDFKAVETVIKGAMNIKEIVYSYGTGAVQVEGLGISVSVVF